MKIHKQPSACWWHTILCPCDLTQLTLKSKTVLLGIKRATSLLNQSCKLVRSVMRTIHHPKAVENPCYPSRHQRKPPERNQSASPNFLSPTPRRDRDAKGRSKSLKRAKILQPSFSLSLQSPCRTFSREKASERLLLQSSSFISPLSAS